MKFVILVHSTPQPWGHPTGDFVAAHQALPAQQREQMERDFEQLLTEMQEAGELASNTLVATVMSNLGLHLAMRAASSFVVMPPVPTFDPRRLVSTSSSSRTSAP